MKRIAYAVLLDIENSDDALALFKEESDAKIFASMLAERDHHQYRVDRVGVEIENITLPLGKDGEFWPCHALVSRSVLCGRKSDREVEFSDGSKKSYCPAHAEKFGLEEGMKVKLLDKEPGE